jgi:lysozyme
MGIPENAIYLAKSFEGFRSFPYLCSAGIPTIGYGSIRYEDGTRVTLKDDSISLEKAEALLLKELSRNVSSVLRLCPILLMDEDKLGAITDFVYNLGAGRLRSSTLRRRINQQDWPETRKELMKWVRGGGKVLPGLVRRRAAEASFIHP